MSYLSRSGFIARSIMNAADIHALSRLEWARNGDAAAADVSKESLVGSASLATVVTALLLTVEEDVDASDTNYATITVYRRTSAGVVTAIGSATTKTSGAGGLDDLGAGVAYGIAVSSGTLAEGDQVTCAITKTGTGVIIPAATLRVEIAPSYVDSRLAIRASEINSRLPKRYATPFAEPVPEIVLGWQEALTTFDCFLKRGFTPGSAQDAEIRDRKTLAETQIKEAADAKDGLFELPMRDDVAGSAITRGAPLMYTEASPFVSADMQERQGRHEDGRGAGTYGGSQ